MEQIRKDIIDAIFSNIPDNMKPVEYIMRILDISKGSAYRRLNGTLPFCYDEIVILAKEMNFSLDEVVHSGSRKKYIFEFGDYFNDNTSTIITKALNDYYNTMYSEQKMNRRNYVITINNLWFIYTLHFDNLFKFFYYKYLQQSDIAYLKEEMKDIEVPQSVIDIKNKLTELLLNMENNYYTSILDRNIFLNTMFEIQYYYRRNLINNEELQSITMDLKNLLNIIEEMIVENKYRASNYQYFLAERNVYTNSASIQNDAQVYGLVFQNNIHPMMCYDQQLCGLHRRYLESHKRQSRLISSSNEQLQIAFFEKQYKYISNLFENRDLVG